MATPPQNPLDPSLKAMQDIAASIQGIGEAFVTAVNTAVGLMEHLAEGASKVTDEVGKAKKGMHELSDDAKKMISHFSDIVDEARKLQVAVKFNTRDLAKTMENMSYKDALRNLKALREVLGTLPDKTKHVTLAMSNLDRVISVTASSGEKDLKKILPILHEIGGAIDGMADSWKRVNLSPFTQKIRAIHNITYGNRVTQKVEEWANKKRQRSELRDFRTQHKQETAERLEHKKKELTGSIKAKADSLKVKIPYLANGEVNLPKLYSKIVNKKRVKDESVRTGALGDFKALGNLQQPGLFGLKAAGEGSYGRGVMSKVGDMAMGMSELALGPVGIGMEIAGVVASMAGKALDANSDKNLDIEKRLGTGGIFSGSESGNDAFMNLRNNLTPAPWDSHNVTYEKQLNIAQALAESGVSIADLSKKGVAPEYFNSVSRTATGAARLSGLDESAATKEIVKLLQVYHVSLANTDDFFRKLNQDTRAAGISTTKYLSILDEITGQFDAMGKSVDTATGLMRMLGRTGLQSADSMKQTLDALVGPKDRPVEMQAYLAGKLAEPKNSESLESGIASLDKTFQDAVQKVRSDAVANGVAVEKGDDLNTPDGLAKFYRRVATVLNDKGGNLATSTFGGDIEQAIANGRLPDSLRSLRNGGNSVDFAGALQGQRANLTYKTMEQLTALKEAAGGQENLNKILIDPSKMDTLNPMLRAKMLEFMQNQPDVLNSLIPAANGGVGTMVSLATQKVPIGQKDMLTDAQYKKLAAAAQAANIMGGKKKGQTDSDYIKSMTSAEDKDKLATAITKMSDMSDFIFPGLVDVLKKQQVSDTEKKVEEVAVSTKKAADIFANSFEYLFNSIAGPISGFAGKLGEWLNHHGESSEPEASMEQRDKLKTEYGADNTQGNYNTLKAMLKNAIDDRDAKIAKGGKPTAAEEGRINLIQRVLSSFDSIKGVANGLGSLPASQVGSTEQVIANVQHLAVGLSADSKGVVSSSTPSTPSDTAAAAAAAQKAAQPDQAKVDAAAAKTAANSPDAKEKTAPQVVTNTNITQLGLTYHGVPIDQNQSSRALESGSSYTKAGDAFIDTGKFKTNGGGGR